MIHVLREIWKVEDVFVAAKEVNRKLHSIWEIPYNNSAAEKRSTHVMEESMEQDMGQGMEQAMEQDMGQGVEQDMEQDMEQGMEQDMEQGMEQDMEENQVNT